MNMLTVELREQTEKSSRLDAAISAVLLVTLACISFL